MSINIAERLIQKINEVQNPSVVGLDPQLPMLPQSIRAWAMTEFGNTQEGAAEAILRFNREIINVISGIVAVVKPQIAFYEMYGAAGWRAFSETIVYAQKKGMLVIADAKRNDIGSTAGAYAQAFLGDVPLFEGAIPGLGADMLTVTPYLGSDGLVPFVEMSEKNNRGIFVLTKTSNRSSGELQDLLVCEKGAADSSNTIYERVAELISSKSLSLVGESGYSPIGAVVGATYPEQARKLRALMPHSFFLVPGFGKQGGTAADTEPCFCRDGYGAIVNSSRGIIYSYKDIANAHFGEDRWQDAVRSAAISMRTDLIAMLRISKKLPEQWR